MTATIYEAAGGRQAFMNLARAWHARCLADPVVSHAFSHGYHPQHTERLAAYWAEALGGPPDYTESMGDESSVVRMHSGNGEHVEMDERAQTCFAQALDDAGIPGDPRLRSTLKALLPLGDRGHGSTPAVGRGHPGWTAFGAVVVGGAGMRWSLRR
jgi:hemoglobin